MTTATPAWPATAFDAPVLRRLDATARAAVVAAGRIAWHAAAAPIYRDGDDSDAFFVVLTGAVELRAIRRGDDAATVLRVARQGDTFGEEALLAGIPRRVAATAVDATCLAEIPIAVFRRVTGRADDATAADRELRYLQRAAVRDLLACSAFARELGAADVDLLLDGLRLTRFNRGATVFAAGDAAEHSYFVVDGLVQLQRDDGGATSVCAYLTRGDFFGDQEVLAGAARGATAVATGDTWCAVVPSGVVRSLGDRNPGLMARLRRIADDQGADQAAVVQAAADRSTQHVFRDLYRMQMARSLLVIDQDSCVRCGHCAWSCEEVHGVSRLIRRGDKVITPLAGAAGGPATLLLPNTCQHCRNAACMIDCPTGAIGRDPAGEVFIRAELCTGCGNCAKACPWDNIQLAVRTPPVLRLSPEVAVKCDLCRDYQAPACVEACPTGSILRLDPARDIAEVAHVLGGGNRRRALPLLQATPATSIDLPRRGGPPPPAASGPPSRAAPIAARPAWPALAIAAATAIALGAGAAGWALQRAGAWTPGRGPGLVAGILAGALIAALAGYVVPKRLIKRRLRRRPQGAARALATTAAPRSRTRGPFIAHVALGALAPAAALAHAGGRIPASPAGALVVALAVATLLGVAGALAYRALPRRLTRLERRGALPEDLAGERDALLARLYREISGTSTLVKLLAERVLVPYARARLGGVALIASGHDLASEERRLRARVDRLLDGRGGGRLDGLDGLVRLSIELRALPARRLLTTALRAWLPMHVVVAAMVVALLLAHIITAVAA